MKKYLVSILIIVAACGAAFLYLQSKKTVPIDLPNVVAPKNLDKLKNSEPKKDLPKQALLTVPFTSQAPTGNWEDDRFQDGCEEASVFMAVKWIKDESFGTAAETEKEIIDISEWEKNKYGSYHDTSAQDTVKRLFQEYFELDNAKAVNNITVNDIKAGLAEGRLVIVPADGTIIGNPNYTAPGPTRHMIVIIGFDETKGEFITNDPGTRKGKDYRYKYQVLYNAIRDYPTGNHEENRGIKKNMIVVER